MDKGTKPVDTEYKSKSKREDVKDRLREFLSIFSGNSLFVL